MVYLGSVPSWIAGKALLMMDIVMVIIMYNFFKHLHKENKKLMQNEKITKGMLEITSDILSCGDINVLLQIILEKAIDLIPNAQKGSILVLDKNDLVYKASVGYDFKVLKKVRIKVEETFQYKSRELYEPCIIKDIEQYDKENINPKTLSKLNQKDTLKIKAVLSSAIVIQGKMFGTINLDNIESEDAFREEDKLHIKHLADQIGIALNNAQLVSEMLELSRFDSLTGAYNRGYFEEMFVQQCNIAKRYNQIFTVCVMDINDLKIINDTYGHGAGDELLEFFAKTIKKHIRETDLFGRIGGDEFGIVFLGIGEKQTSSIMEKIVDIFRETPIEFEGDDYFVSFAFGTSQYPSEGENSKTLAKIADNRMYVQKAGMKEHAV